MVATCSLIGSIHLTMFCILHLALIQKIKRTVLLIVIVVFPPSVHQILEAARQHRNVSPSDKASCASASLSWSEFCIFTIELLFLSKSQSQSDAAAK